MHLILKPGRERSLERRHPWIFSGSIADVVDAGEAGATVDILDSRRRWLARGAWSPASQIRCRAWTFDPDVSIDAAFFRSRLTAAIAYRRSLGYCVRADDQAVRLVHGEADSLPGLVVDRYADTLVIQFLGAGVERWRGQIVESVCELTGIEHVFERSDTDARKREGLQARCGCLAGAPPRNSVSFTEGGVRYRADVQNGHKTGFYLDQAINRGRIAQVADGKSVLNCFCYTGAFGLSALSGGASSVLQMDSSENALALARTHAEDNGFPLGAMSYCCGDVFRELRALRDRGESFDMIVLDPPKFADNRTQLDGACRGYKDINLLAMKLLREGGRLFTFSCSGAMSPELFRKVVSGAILDSGRQAAVLGELHQSPDHPVMLHIPETLYLKGLELVVR